MARAPRHTNWKDEADVARYSPLLRCVPELGGLHGAEQFPHWLPEPQPAVGPQGEAHRRAECVVFSNVARSPFLPANPFAGRRSRSKSQRECVTLNTTLKAHHTFDDFFFAVWPGIRTLAAACQSFKNTRQVTSLQQDQASSFVGWASLNNWGVSLGQVGF